MDLPEVDFIDPNVYQNRIPLRSEIDAILGHIKLAEEHQALMASMAEQAKKDALVAYEDLQAAQSVYSMTVIRYESLLRQLHSDQVLIEEQRGLLNPIRRIPHEILAEFFRCVEAVEDWMPCQIAEDSPRRLRRPMAFYLASVCQRWRTVALNTPELWKRIPIIDYPNTSDFADALQTEVGMVAELIKRSKKMELYITVFRDLEVPRHAMLFQNWSRLLPADRVASLEVYLGKDGVQNISVQHINTLFHRLPSTKDVSISYANDDPDATAVLLPLPASFLSQTVELECEKVQPVAEGDSEAAAYPLLRYLALPASKVLRHILRQAPNLAELTITDSCGTEPDYPNASISLSHPKLHTLCIENCQFTDLNNHFATGLSFPALTTLKLDPYPPPKEMPVCLQFLDFIDSRSRIKYLELFDDEDVRHGRGLSDITSPLERLSNVETLTVDYWIGVQVLRLLSLDAARSQSRVILPKLSRVIVDDCRLKGLFGEMVAARDLVFTKLGQNMVPVEFTVLVG